MRKSVLIHIVSGGTEVKSTDVFISYKVCSNNSVLCCIRSWTPPGRRSSTSPHVREIFSCGIRNPRGFCLWNPESWPQLWNPEYSSRNSESYLRLESRIQVPLTKTKIQNPRLSRIPLHEAGPVKQDGLLYRHAFPIYSNVVKSTLTRQVG